MDVKYYNIKQHIRLNYIQRKSVAKKLLNNITNVETYEYKNYLGNEFPSNSIG